MMVLQDTFLFSGTGMENIHYGRLDANDEEVTVAAHGWPTPASSSPGCQRATRPNWASAATI